MSAPLLILGVLAVWLGFGVYLWRLSADCGERDWGTRLGIIGWPAILIWVLAVVVLLRALEAVHWGSRVGLDNLHRLLP